MKKSVLEKKGLLLQQEVCKKFKMDGKTLRKLVNAGLTTHSIEGYRKRFYRER